MRMRWFLMNWGSRVTTDDLHTPLGARIMGGCRWDRLCTYIHVYTIEILIYKNKPTSWLRKRHIDYCKIWFQMVNTFDVAWLKTSRYMPTTPTMMAYPNSIHWKQHTYVCIPEKASKSEQMTVSIPASMLLSLQWEINNYKLTTSCCNHCVVYTCNSAWCKAFTAGFDYDSLVIRPWFVQAPYLAELIHSLFQQLRSMRDGFNIATTLVTLTLQNRSYPRKTAVTGSAREANTTFAHTPYCCSHRCHNPIIPAGGLPTVVSSSGAPT